MFKEADYVMSQEYGLCTIVSSLGENSEQETCYQLKKVNSEVLLEPQSSATLRHPMSKEKADNLLGRLKDLTVKWIRKPALRNEQYAKMVAGGKAEDLATAIKYFYFLNKYSWGKGLGALQDLFDKAKSHFFGELAHVYEISEEEAMDLFKEKLK